ncbi:DUF7927 domain-containing protein [Nocardioides limicola]|uniref:DUF7927 domain-containing protein n=1 Tax=Nocardioides limicola TaxID=2803368 RepID=UPI00193C2D37|nr:SpaA isopeptide-forming pilin-related protein [Nocardioides sp. DJM-14]
MSKLWSVPTKRALSTGHLRALIALIAALAVVLLATPFMALSASAETDESPDDVVAAAQAAEPDPEPAPKPEPAPEPKPEPEPAPEPKPAPEPAPEPEPVPEPEPSPEPEPEPEPEVAAAVDETEQAAEEEAAEQESVAASSTLTTKSAGTEPEDDLIAPMSHDGCGPNSGTGTIPGGGGFAQNTKADSSGNWIHSVLNNNNSNYAEGQFVPQRIIVTGLNPGTNHLVIGHQVTKGGKYAYDYLGNLAISPGSASVSWDAVSAPLAAFPGANHEQTVHITFQVPNGVTEVTITFGGHIASEFDYGPGLGAGSISGAPYHIWLESLNCASAGNRDNQLMASALESGHITIAKQAQPPTADLFSFDLSRPDANFQFQLAHGGSVTFWVAPGGYAAEEINLPAGWTLDDIVCVNTGDSSSSVNVGNATASITVADGGTTTCTFHNTKTSSLIVDKVWVVNGQSYPNGQQPDLMSAGLLLDGAGHSFGVPKTGYLSGTQVSIDETVDFESWLCTLDDSRVTSVNGANTNHQLPHLATLDDPDNTFTITNTVTCDSALTLIKLVDNGDTGGTAVPADWMLHANGPDNVQGAGGFELVTVTPGAYTLSESGGPGGYTAGDWDCDGGSLSGDVVTVALGETATCVITNTAIAGEYIGEKTSDPVSGSTVEPGDVITYTVTLTKTNDGVNLLNVVTTDDLSGVLAHATLVDGSINASAGTAALVGDQLVWELPVLSGTETLTYQVLVNDDAWGVTLVNVVTSDGAEECIDGCTTTHHTPHYLLHKSSVPPSGSEVLPGDQIVYTLHVENDSDGHLSGKIVEDDLSGVLANATLDEGSLPPSAILAGTTLIWGLPDLAPGETAELSYTVTVNAGAWNVELVNVATPDEAGDCVEACSTDHFTPPVTTLVIKKVDFETGEALAGAVFELWHNDELIDTQVSDADGLAKFGELLPGDYLVVEVAAPDGYALPDDPTMAITIDDDNFVPMGEMAEILFTNAALGQIEVVAKQQFTRSGGEWVLAPSGSTVEYGDRVLYRVAVRATGRKLFHDVTVTDYIPGMSPEDETSTLVAEYRDGTARCVGIDCVVTVDDDGLITWAAGTITDVEFTVEFEVFFPDVDIAPGTSSEDFLWNVGYLGWSEFVGFEVIDSLDPDDIVARGAAARAATEIFVEHLLRSNEVVIGASGEVAPFVEDKTPGKLPPGVAGLPEVGLGAYLAQLALLALVLLMAGLALLRMHGGNRAGARREA